MTGIVRRRGAARRDLVLAYRYLAREAGGEVADRFLDAAEATFRTLAASPEMGKRLDHAIAPAGEIRHFPLAAFRSYLVFYRPIEGGMEVIRVLHGARDIDGILAAEFGIYGEGGSNS